jgi:cytoskeletal protein CcmA (bactofilin family)
MALFVKEDKSQRHDELHPPVEPPRHDHVTTRDVQAHLGQGSRVEGKLSFEGSVRIDGQIDGEINAKDTVTIGDAAVINGQIHANTVIVHGRVQGDVTARKRVELRAPARLIGNLATPSLVIHEGVVFEGNCKMGADDGQADRTDKKVAIFPKDERGAIARRSSEA